MFFLELVFLQIIDFNWNDTSSMSSFISSLKLAHNFLVTFYSLCSSLNQRVIKKKCISDTVQFPQ